MGTPAEGLEVLVAQTWRSVALGPFASLADALHGIEVWLATPAGYA